MVVAATADVEDVEVAEDVAEINLLQFMKNQNITIYVLFLFLLNYTGYQLIPWMQELANWHNSKVDSILFISVTLAIFFLGYHLKKYLQNKSKITFCCGIILFLNIFMWVAIFSKIECFYCSRV